MSRPPYSEAKVADLIAASILRVEDGNHGEYRPRREEFSDKGTAFIRAADLNASGVAFEQAEKISETALMRIRKGVGAPCDTILSHKGTVGKIAYAPPNSPPFVCSPQTTFWRSLDYQKIHPRFLCYQLKSDAFQSQLDALKGESDMAPYVSLTEQRKLRLVLPPIPVQEAVAAMLGSLDDKIAANKRIALTALELAEAQFAAATTLEPRLVSVGDVAVFHNRRRVPLSSKQRSEMAGQYPYYGANGIVDHVAEFIFDGDYVLAGEDGTVVTGSGAPVAQNVHGQFWVNNHAHVLTGDSVSNEILLMALKSADVRPLVTGAVQPKLSMGNLKKLPLALPSERVASQLEPQLRELFTLAESKNAESRTLAELRDTLLPGLMSGAIRARDAENAVEEAT